MIILTTCCDPMDQQQKSFLSAIEHFSNNAPKPVFIRSIDDLDRFLTACESAAEYFLYVGWRGTFKVGGVLFRELRANEPKNPGIVKFLNEHHEVSRDAWGGRGEWDMDFSGPPALLRFLMTHWVEVCRFM